MAEKKKAPITAVGQAADKKKALETALHQIEKDYGKGAIMRLGEDIPVNVESIPTGSLGLDIALGIGGVPRGRIVEIYGPEASGKTTLALHIVASAQRGGGEAAYIDVEHALEPAYARAVGVDIDNLLVSQPDYGEQALSIAEALEVDPHWLMRGKLVDRSTRFKGFVEVPLFTSITAGQPASPDQTDERFPVHKELAERYPGAFLLRVSGESMNRILPAGCYALVEPCEAVGRQNMPYAVAVGSLDATVKRVRALGNGFALTPDSTDVTFHEVIYDYTKEDTEQVTVMGRVVSYYLPLNWSF